MTNEGNLKADTPVEGTPEDQEQEYQRQLAEESLEGHPALPTEEDE